MSKKTENKHEEINNTSEEEVAETVEAAIDPQQLAAEIEKLKNDLAKAQNDYYKAYADTENLKKRLQNEADQANKYRIQSFALNILPSIDALEMALNGKDEKDPFVKGVKLTYDQLMHALEMEGVKVIECLNQPFDANYCHAIVSEEVEGVEPGMVVEVLQKGYMLKDRLLRAALVKVSE